MGQKGSVAILAAKKSPGVAPEVNLRNITGKQINERKQGIYPDFETLGRCYQNRVSIAPQKTLMSSNFFLNWRGQR